MRGERGTEFAHYERRHVEEQIKRLSEEELWREMNTPLPKNKPHLHLTRDMFVFACFTGLSYSDMRDLTEEKLRPEPYGTLWIRTVRNKTGVECNIPLLDIPLGIIEKYREFGLGGDGGCVSAGEDGCKLLPVGSSTALWPTPDGDGDRDNLSPIVALRRRGAQHYGDENSSGGRLLPVLKNDVMNRQLKTIARICGVEDNITFHMGRHTFASEVALANGMPIETVSSLLGHTDLDTTQIYAKVTDGKIDLDMTAATGRIVERFRIALGGMAL